MAGLGWQELLIILVIVVIIFGGAKIAGVGKASGRAIREFKDELRGSDPAPGQLGSAAASAPTGATGGLTAPVAGDTTEAVPPEQTPLR